MTYKERANPLFSACGLNCGLCPRRLMDGASKCPGCGGAGFQAKHPACGALSCCQRRGLDYCFSCAEYPCGKYDGADQADSFITHLHQLQDMEKAKRLGIEAYQQELDEKIAIVQRLLAGYDDGRRKGFYCLAVNLLELADVRSVWRELAAAPDDAAPIKEKAATAVRLFQAMADARGISLKLRKRTAPKGPLSATPAP